MNNIHKYIILSILTFGLVFIFCLYFRIIDFRSNEQKTLLIQNYFISNPMVENGFSFYSNVDIDNLQSMLDDLKYGTYENKLNYYKYIGVKNTGANDFSQIEFIFQRFRKFVVVRYTANKISGIKKVSTRSFEFYE